MSKVVLGDFETNPIINKKVRPKQARSYGIFLLNVSGFWQQWHSLEFLFILSLLMRLKIHRNPLY